MDFEKIIAAYITGSVSIIVAIISVFLTYIFAIKKAKKDISLNIIKNKQEIFFEQKYDD